MIDPADTITQTLPTIEPPPPAPRPLTEAQRKAAAGYLGPKQRSGCQNCARSLVDVWNEGTPYESRRLVCMAMKMDTLKTAICDRYERRERRTK